MVAVECKPNRKLIQYNRTIHAMAHPPRMAGLWDDNAAAYIEGCAYNKSMGINDTRSEEKS